MKDNTSKFICQLDTNIQEEIKNTIKDRLIALGEYDMDTDYAISDCMNERLCSICDNDIILHKECLQWSNNESIYNSTSNQ